MAQVQADLVLNVDEALSQIEQMGDLINDVTSSVEINVEVDTDQADAAIAGIDAPPIDVDVDADTATAEAEISAVGDNAAPVEIEVSTSGVTEAESQIDSLASSAEEAGSALTSVASALGSGGLAAALGSSIGAFAEADRVTAIAEQRIESLGSSAVTSASEMAALGTEVQRYAGVSDESVVSAQSLLLTFENLSNNAITTSENFERATKAIFDISTVQGNAQSNAIALGKALEDPVAGLGRLGRAGITFTDAQKEVIASLVETGDIAGAQALILDEIEDKYGGLAAAAGDNLAGAMDRAGEAFGDFTEDVGAAAGTAIEPAANAVAALFEGFQELPEGVQGAIAAFAALSLAAGAALLAVRSLASAIPSVGTALAATGGFAPILVGLGVAITIAATAYGFLAGSADEAEASTAAVAAAGRELGNQFSRGIGLTTALATQIGTLAEQNSGAEGTLSKLDEVLQQVGLTYGEFANLIANGDLGIAELEELARATGDVDTTSTEIIDTLTAAGDALNAQADAAIEAALAAGTLSEAELQLAEDAARAEEGLTYSGDPSGVAVIRNLPAEVFAAAEALAELADAALSHLPTLEQAISNVEDNLATFGQTIDTATDAQLVINNLAEMLSAFENFATNLEIIAAEGGEFGPQLAAALAELGPDVAGGLAQAFAESPQAFADQFAILELEAQRLGVSLTELLGAQFGDAATAGADSFGSKSGEFESAAAGYGEAGARAVKEKIDQIGGFADEAATSAANRVKSKTGEATQAGFSFGFGFTGGTKRGTDGMDAAARAGTSAAVAAVRGGAGAALAGGQVVGQAFTTGMEVGIAIGIPGVAAAAREAVRAAVQAAESEAGIASPSKVFKLVGEQMAEGMAIGLADSAAVVAAAEALTRAAAYGAAGSSMSVGDTFVTVDARGASDPQGVADAVSGALERHRRSLSIRLAQP